jgi:SAM-dependent methyltransferase
VDASTVLVEFAPGDCQFLVDVARRVRFAYGIDISDQRSLALPSPDNFRLIVYDGDDTREIADSSVDVVFSDQLIEHIAPDETEAHFALAHRLLRPGGRYVFCTPHRLTGPHDVSAYFSDEPQGFHLKEWTYREIVPLLRRVGFARCQAYWTARGRTARLPVAYFTLCERVLGPLPRRLARPVCRALTPAILVAAEK